MPHKAGKSGRVRQLEMALRLLTHAAQRVIQGQGGAPTMKRVMEAQDLLSRKIHQIKGS